MTFFLHTFVFSCKQVRFHPSQPDTLATGSTDGLVCVFDISQTSEDDAISWTFNAESSVVSTR